MFSDQMLRHTKTIPPNDLLSANYQRDVAAYGRMPPVYPPIPQLNDSKDVYVLSLGLGQESSYLYFRYLHDPDFRNRYAPGRFIVLVADTGNEHPATLLHAAFMQALSDQAGIEYYYLTADQGYHSGNWSTLTTAFATYNAIGSKAYPKSCTVRLKIEPCYRFLEQWLSDNYGVVSGRKKAFYQFKEAGGQIMVMLGLATGEESRIGNREKEPLWMQRNVQKSYPLISMGMSRQDCQAGIRELGYPLPPPSLCMFCPWNGLQDVLWLSRFYPDVFAEWVRLEANKLAFWAGKTEKNLGVFGAIALPAVLELAQVRYGHLSDGELSHIKMNHGHCVKSKY